MDVAVFIALLRGINVAGKNIVKMIELKQTFEELGLVNVRTYLQSGNVVFSGPAQSETDMAKIIEAALQKKLGLTVPVNVRTSDRMKVVVEGNPFLSEGIGKTGKALRSDNESKFYVTFLSDEASDLGLQKLKCITSIPDRYAAVGEEVYLHCPDGYGRSKFSNNVIERALKTGATTRNWKTVKQLVAISQECHF